MVQGVLICGLENGKSSCGEGNIEGLHVRKSCVELTV